MRQRTRVVQRNVRMVLILVDGKATAAELGAKTGNSLRTESALRELEQGGFIVPLTAPDSAWEQGKKVAQEIRSAAMEQVAQFAGLGDKNEVPRVEPSMPAPASQAQPGADRTQASVPSRSPFSVAAASSLDVPVIDNVATVDADQGPHLPEAAARPERAAPPAWLDGLKAFLHSAKARAADDDLKIKPLRRGGERYYVSRSLAVVFGVLGLIIFVVLAAFLFPYGSYLPDVEAALAQLSGQAAKVGEMRVSLYPKPGLLLGDVRLGSADDGKEIRISEVRLQPVLGTLLAAKKVFHEVELSGVTLPAEAVAGFSGMFEAAAQPSAKVGVQHVTLENAAVALRGLGFSEMGGEIKLAPDGRFQLLSLHSADRSLQLEAKPLAKGLAVQLDGFGWRPSAASPFVFDSASVKGNLAGSVFTISSMELRIFDGLIQGVAALHADKQPGLAGDLVFERISAKRLGAAFGVGAQFEGETSGKMKFAATAEAWPAIFSTMNADGEFSMLRGSIAALDLAEAVRRTSASPTRGGFTRFEQLSGKFKLLPASCRFSGLVINSGLMQSTGQIEVSKDLQVSGRLEVQMRGTVNQMRMPVSISGPLKAPVLQAGRR